MTRDLVILVAEDDDGHARLIQKNLARGGLTNRIERFSDGQEIIDFLFRQGTGRKREENTPYLLLLDIRMPKVDGVEVLRRIKQDPELVKMPVSMLSTTDDPREVERCHELGCGAYLVKPVDYHQFEDVIRNLGLFFTLVEVPQLGGNEVQ